MLKDDGTEQKKRNNNNNNLPPPPSPPSILPGLRPFIPSPPPPSFQPPQSILIPFNHHHHHHQDLIILLGIFIFQHNFHLQILVTEGKYCLETYLAHRQKPSPEKTNGKKLFRTVSNKNRTTQFTNYQIHQNLN